MLRPTPTILELADKSIVTIASWEYAVDFLVLQTNDHVKEHPVILGSPWMEISNSFIGCREIMLTISNCTSLQNLTIYPPTQPITKNMLWLEIPYCPLVNLGG